MPVTHSVFLTIIFFLPLTSAAKPEAQPVLINDWSVKIVERQDLIQNETVDLEKALDALEALETLIAYRSRTKTEPIALQTEKRIPAIDYSTLDFHFPVGSPKNIGPLELAIALDKFKIRQLYDNAEPAPTYNYRSTSQPICRNNGNHCNNTILRQGQVIPLQATQRQIADNSTIGYVRQFFFQSQSDGRIYSCLGTLIGQKTMLTSAHCLTGINRTTGLVLKKPNKQLTESHWAEAHSQHYIIHPHYKKMLNEPGVSKSQGIDIAIIHWPTLVGAEFTTIALSPPKPGDPASLIAFGDAFGLNTHGLKINADKEAKNQLWQGRNTITDTGDTIKMIAGPYPAENLPSGQQLNYAGAPLFTMGHHQLSGLFSATAIISKSGESKAFRQLTYTSLWAPAVRQFLKQHLPNFGYSLAHWPDKY